MPGILLPQRRPRAEEDEEESDNGSQSSKRARMTPDEDDEDNEEDADAEESQLLPDSYLRSPPRIAPREPHKPGALVRIKVKNFVTYSSAEFICGPSLNMIIGPNGTGKSTLVCAICLGLGAKTSVLGRAKDISEYVKHGCDSAEIEIELKADPAKRMKENPIIRHFIKREGNKSTWQLNGRTTTHKEVLSFVKAFNIQIDNLCQFLPQDRVADFAKMTPIEKLEETQKAAARPEMAQWHNELKGLGAERKKHIADQEQSKTHLAQLQKRQDDQRADVERMTERKNLLEKVDFLDKIRPGLEYLVAKKEYDELRNEKRIAEADLAELRTQVEPSMQGVRDKESYSEEVKAFVESRKRVVDLADARAKESKAAVDNFKALVDQCDTEEQAESDAFKKGREKAKKIEHQLTVLKNRLNEEEAIEFNAAEFNERIRAKQAEINNCVNRAEEIKSSRQELRSRKGQADQQRDEIRQKIANLKSQSGQQLAKLEQFSRDTARAWNWIQKNQDKFREPILGPALLVCTVKDERYTAAIESKMQKGDWLAFTASNKDDWNTLGQYLTGRGEESQRLTDIFTRVADRGMDRWQSPVSAEDLKPMGLDFFMIDLIEGPDRVLSALCDSSKMHMTGVSLQESTESQFSRLQNSPIESWVAGRNSYKITRRREYGHSSTSNSTIPQGARFWNKVGAVNADVEQGHQASLLEVESDLQSISDEWDRLKEELDPLSAARERASEEKRLLEKEKGDRQKAYSEHLTLPRRINTLEEEVARSANARRDYIARLHAIHAKKDGLVMERGAKAIEYATLAAGLRKLHGELLEAEIWLIEATSEASILKEKSNDVQQMLQTRETALNQLGGRLRTAKDRASRVAKIFQRARDQMDEESELFREWVNPSKTLQDLDNEIQETRSRIDLLHGGNPGAIQAYEARAIEIQKLTERIANFDADLAQMSERIATIRAQWEPELDSIVAKISDAFTFNFQKIKCSGEVTVVKDEDDFSQWSLQLRAKFREEEPMSVVDNHRQSGGERAVSTIFYLMALQSLARSPFRVVDEINQGMDQRNERIVHGRMVDIACNGDTSQYFLVTPKLLNGLKYHPKMVVHCIYSSETMPVDNKGLDLGSLADLALRVMGKVM